MFSEECRVLIVREIPRKTLQRRYWTSYEAVKYHSAILTGYLQMGLEPEIQKQLYLDYWRPMEVDFGQDAYEKHFDGFMRHYLIVKTDSIPRLGDFYDAFKNYVRSPEVLSAGVEALVKDIREFARYYCAIALGVENDPELKQGFHDLRELKVDVAAPLLLELYHDYVNNLLSKKDLIEAVRMVESYVFRRAVCSIPTNSMNKTFAVFSKALKKDRYLESIRAHFLLRMILPCLEHHLCPQLRLNWG